MFPKEGGNRTNRKQGGYLEESMGSKNLDVHRKLIKLLSWNFF